MASPNRTTPMWKKIVGYTAFTIFALVACLYLTFPYEIIEQQLVAGAKGAGYHVTMDPLGPGLLGVTATNVKVAKSLESMAMPLDGSDPKPPEKLLIDRISVRPSLFPPGVSIRAKLLDGTVNVGVGGLGNVKVAVSLDDLDLSKGNLKGFSGMDLSGTLEGDVALDLPRALNPATKQMEPDLAQANGTIELDGRSLSINGGTITVPMYGTPTPLDLPKVVLGDVAGKIKIEKGLTTIDTFRGKSEDLELIIGGTIKLAKKLDYSELAVSLKLKAEQEFVKRLGMIGMGVSMMQADKQDPTFRSACITGYVGKPNPPAPCR